LPEGCDPPGTGRGGLTENPLPEFLARRNRDEQDSRTDRERHKSIARIRHVVFNQSNGIVLLLALNTGGAEIVVDNRLSQPVEVVTARGIESFQPGERVVDMSTNFFVTSVAGTNGLTFNYNGPRARLVVVASSTTNQIVGSLEPETALAEYPIRGFSWALGMGLFALVVVFARRTLGLAFGGYRED